MASTAESPGGLEEENGLSDGTTYVVQHGDTLAGVALRLGLKQSDLKRANHMYGSKSLITGQLLKLDGTLQQKLDTTMDVEMTTITPPAVANAAASAEDDYNGKSSVVDVENCESTATKIEAASGTARLSLTEQKEEKIVEPQPQEEEIWFSQGSGMVGIAGSPGEPVDVSARGSVTGTRQDCTPENLELLYVPPHWGEGFEDAATSRRASDASSSSTPRVSLRGVIRYMFSPSSSALKAAGDTFAELRPASNAGSATGTAGVPAGDEGVPAGEMWDEGGGRGSTRERPSWSGGYSDAAAQAAERGCDQATGAADADVVAPERSTAQTLLSMVRPSFWRRADEEEEGRELVVERVGATAAREQNAARDGDDKGVSVEAAAAAAGGERDTGSRPPSFGFGESAYSSVESSGVPVAETMASFRGAWGDSDQVGVLLSPPLVAAPPPEPAPLKLPGLVVGASTIVTHSTLARLEAALPKHYRGYNWYLLFSTFRDGASYIQLYSRIKAEEPTYLVVENMKGEVFGGFATSAWSSGCQYYGTGECFLFKVVGERLSSAADAPPAEGDSHENGGGANKALLEGEITTYGWTGMNTYLQYSDDVGIGMGGGGAKGSFGLLIGEDFLDGSTGKCDTFDNPPLCSSEHFEISQMEVWGFTTADSEMGARLERLRKTLRGRTTRPL